jgi:hypothetical protein
MIINIIETTEHFRTNCLSIQTVYKRIRICESDTFIEGTKQQQKQET